MPISINTSIDYAYIVENNIFSNNICITLLFKTSLIRNLYDPQDDHHFGVVRRHDQRNQHH